jgi:hypothetical protein
MTDLNGVFQPAPKNHNNPPSETEYLRENLTLRHVQLIRKAEEYIQTAARIPAEFTQDVEASYTTDFLKNLQECTKDLERNREEEKSPFLRQGQLVDSFFNELKMKVAEAGKRAAAVLNAYLQKKAAEEAARRAAEAEQMRLEQLAAHRDVITAMPDKVEAAVEHATTMNTVAKVAQTIAAQSVTSMATATGKRSVAALKTSWEGTITDVANLDLNKLRPYFTLPDLQKVVDRYVKQGGRQCEGVKITESVGVKVK